MSSEIPIKRFHHVEFVVGNALQAAYFWREALGFDVVGYRGPETGVAGTSSYALRQGNAQVVVTAPMTHDHGLGVLHLLHGDTGRDICFEVGDLDAAMTTLAERGATIVRQPETMADDHGKVKIATVRTYGDVQHSLVQRDGYDGPFLPGFEARDQKGRNAGLMGIDHIVGNVEDHQMDRWARFYIETFGFNQFVSYDDKDINTEFTALRSKVVANDSLSIKMPINEPADGKKRSQIQEYVDFHVTAGVQHLALITADIIGAVGTLRENGVEFLSVPSTYYEEVWDRVGDVQEDRDELRRLQILVDRDESGYLLQTFTRPLQDRPTFFVEIIQRRGCQSFGKGNFRALFESIEREQSRRGNL